MCVETGVLLITPCIESDNLAQHTYPIELRIPTYLFSRSLLGAKIEDPKGLAQNQRPAAMLCSFLALL